MEYLSFLCGLTTGKRVRCQGEIVVSTPPLPPVQSFALHWSNGTFLGSDGRIEAQGRWDRPPLAFSDSVVAVSGNVRHLAALLADGGVRVGSRLTQPVGPIVAIAGRFGLRDDGGVVDFDDGGVWDVGAPVERLAEGDPLGEVVCALRDAGDWLCSDQTVLPRRWVQLLIGIPGGCGLTARGKLECARALSPQLSAMRFKSAGALGLITADGQPLQFLNFASGDPETVQCPWDDFVQFKATNNPFPCGIREDGTGICLENSQRKFPWSGK